MRKIIWILCIFLVAYLGVAAQEVPRILPESAPRHYIDIPEGKLPQFLSWHPVRIPFVSAHRGGPMPGYPENAIETFDHTLKYGPALIEIDIAQLSDGTLILMHDDTLERTTTGSGWVSEKSWSEIKGVTLKDNDGRVTDFRVPTLREALEWSRGRALLNLDYKRGTDFNKVAALVKETGTIDNVIGISYSLEMAHAIHAAHPQMAISVSVSNLSDIEQIKASGLPLDRLVAWTGTRLRTKALYDAIHQEGWLATIGTLGRRETSIDSQILKSGDDSRYQEIVLLGGDIIASDRHWAVQPMIRNPNYFYFLRRSDVR